jgi:hypothetical protein
LRSGDLVSADTRSIRQRTRAEVMAISSIGEQNLRAIELALLVDGYALREE